MLKPIFFLLLEVSHLVAMIRSERKTGKEGVKEVEGEGEGQRKRELYIYIYIYICKDH